MQETIDDLESMNETRLFKIEALESQFKKINSLNNNSGGGNKKEEGESEECIISSSVAVGDDICILSTFNNSNTDRDSDNSLIEDVDETPETPFEDKDGNKEESICEVGVSCNNSSSNNLSSKGYNENELVAKIPSDNYNNDKESSCGAASVKSSKTDSSKNKNNSKLAWANKLFGSDRTNSSSTNIVARGAGLVRSGGKKIKKKIMLQRGGPYEEICHPPSDPMTPTATGTNKNNDNGDATVPGTYPLSNSPKHSNDERQQQNGGNDHLIISNNNKEDRPSTPSLQEISVTLINA